METISLERENMDRWIQSQENTVAEMLTRPGKLRQDAAQIDLNIVSDLKQTIMEKNALLDDMDMRLEIRGLPVDHNTRIALDTLEEHVGRTIFS